MTSPSPPKRPPQDRALRSQKKHRGKIERHTAGPRRAWSALASGRTGSRGAQALVGGLLHALTEPGRRHSQDIAESLTHPLHSYPARMHPATAKALVELAGEWGRPAALIDPFCGSGTTLVEARAAGALAHGLDASPLAVLIARAKSEPLTRALRDRLRRAALSMVRESLAAGKAARRAGVPAAPLRGIAGTSMADRNKALAGWFPRHIRRELENLAGAIDRFADTEPLLADKLRACLSAILYKVSRRSSESDRTFCERSIARGAAARLFGSRVELLLEGLAELGAHNRVRAPQIALGDAREPVSNLPGGCIITSPPYPGTYDYAEQQRLRSIFLGLEVTQFAHHELGSRRRLARGPHALKEWRRDFKAVLANLSALSGGELITLLMGDSIASHRALFAVDEVRQALPRGWELAARAWQERPLRGSAEKRAFTSRPKSEHLLVLAPR